MAVITANETNFKEITSSGVVLVDFYADWCGPCKMLAPVLDDLAADLQDAKVVKVNVDEAKSLAIEYKVSSIPNITILKDGEVVHQDVGFKPKEVLQQLIDAHR